MSGGIGIDIELVRRFKIGTTKRFFELIFTKRERDYCEKKKEPHIKNINKIYCAEVERTINSEGCYDSKGSYDCKTCLVKPARKEVNKIYKNNKQFNR